MFASVIVDSNYSKLDKTFTYIVPTELEELIRVGMTVLVPFGKGNRPMKAYVMEIMYDIPESTLDDGMSFAYKEITGIYKDKLKIEDKLIALAGFIKHNFGGTMAAALKIVMPVRDKVREVTRHYIYRSADVSAIKNIIANTSAAHKNVLALLKRLVDEEVISFTNYADTGVSKTTLEKLVKEGIIRIDDKREYREVCDSSDEETLVSLNAEQKAVYDDFVSKYDMGVRDTSLIYGITGSGKTEVYIYMASHVVSLGRKVIILIPEIALTKQTVERFRRRFGERVAILNSKLNQGEKYDQMSKIHDDEVDVVIGPRSALFVPFADVGLIIIDEEHEGSYRSEQAPRYDTREVAREFARLHDASLVLGSATPSLISYKRAMEHEYAYYELKNRAIEGATLPDVSIVDLRAELSSGNLNIISRELDFKIRDRLSKHEQIMLFINRRGVAGFISCRQCGFVIKCPHCDVSMRLHNDGKLRCHYCMHTTEMVKTCPKCGSKYIGTFKAGTQRLEEVVRKMYPTAKVLRMDSDTVSKKGEYEGLLETFRKKEADILIGTQMIIKGHDFPDVTLVGIMAADMSLYVDDYSAAETTYQIVAQASGRAGRSAKKGEVVLQTYSPDHYCIQAAARQDYRAFYDTEYAFRKNFGYPPFSNMLAIRVMSKDEEELVKCSKSLAMLFVMNADGEEVLGPQQANIYKLNDYYRHMIYVKSPYYENLVAVKDIVENEVTDNPDYRKVLVGFEFTR
ncbi:MAG: primosomal protein N' [Lachnospiraceae bacterium]|nr:primosomal protein N' [Lachnospiraceae bacterium]